MKLVLHLVASCIYARSTPDDSSAVTIVKSGELMALDAETVELGFCRALSPRLGLVWIRAGLVGFEGSLRRVR